jgi:hypothetical protein
MPKPVFGLILLVLGSLTLVSPASLHAWELGPGGLAASVSPSPAVPLASPPGADLEGDGRLETLALTQGRATIQEAGRSVWQSPADWQVLQAALTDLDRDGRPEVALLVWRAFQPWPVDRWLPSGGRIRAFHDAAGQSCQLILIGWRREGQYGELWAGSALAEPLRAFAAADLNGDGAQELVTLDGRYVDPRAAPARDLKVWEWNGFGFTVVSSLPGTFDRMALVRAADGRTFILTP